MKKKNTAEFVINIRLNNQRSRRGKSAIYIRLTMGNQRVELASHQYIEAMYWNQKLQRVISNADQAGQINNALDIIKGDFQKHYNKMKALGLDVTAQSLKNTYLGKSEREKTLNELSDFYFTRFKEKVSSRTKANNTLKSIFTTNGKLKEFLKYQYRTSDIVLKDLRGSFISNFEHFLTTQHGLSNNSAMKYIRILKRIIKFGVEQDWIGSSPFAQFRCSYIEPQRDRLTMDEVMILYY